MANEVDEFLKDIKDDAQVEPFSKDASDPLNQGGTDKGIVDDKDEKVPFHKDPKVQRYIDKEIAKRIKDVKPTEVEKFTKDVGMDEDELTETLTEIIGNDTPQKIAAIKKFRNQLGKLEEKGAERALAQLREQAEAESAEEAQAQEELANAFESIEEEFEVDLTSNTTAARKERNDFIDFIKRVSPKDGNGDVIQYPDFEETYKLFKSTQKPVENKRAKDISSRSMTRSTDTGSAPTTGKTWKDVDKAFAKLAN